MSGISEKSPPSFPLAGHAAEVAGARAAHGGGPAGPVSAPQAEVRAHAAGGPVPANPDVLVPPQQDPILYTAVLLLTGFGIVMVYSASAVYARQKFGSSTYFLERCLLWNLMGLCAMGVTSRLDYSVYKKYVYPFLGLGIGLLLAVLFAGVRINGAKRWFHLFGVSFQPAELAKLSLIMYLSYSLSKKAEKVRLFAVGLLPHLFVCGLIMLLLLKQPDLGTAVMAGGVTIVLLFVAGAKISYLFMALLAAAPIIYQAIVGTPFRMRRVLAYLDPWQFRHDAGYQVAESLISVGSGGATGLGLGDGRHKLFFLPEAHTDYIMAIVGEELGFVGICLVAAVFVVVVLCGCRAAYRARDSFGCYLGFGITAMIGFQAAINLGVVLGSLPTKGLPLPFVSFGGSSLVIDLMAVGILLNISRGGPEVPVRLGGALGARRLLAQIVRKARNNRRRPGGGRRVVIDTDSRPRKEHDAPDTTRVDAPAERPEPR